MSDKIKWKGSERRKFPRIDAKLPISYRILFNLSASDFKVFKDKTLEGMTRDIGLKGLCVKTDQQIPVGSILEIKINFPEQPIKLITRVVWSEKIRAEEQYFTGVEYTAIPDDQINVTLQFIIKLILSLDKSKGLDSESILHEIFLHTSGKGITKESEDGEKRKFPRINTRTPVKYRIFSDLSPLDLCQTYTRDVSLRGLCIRTDKILPSHTILELIIEFRRESIKVLGKVVWSQEIESLGKIYTGIEYLAMADDQVAIMTQLIVEILIEKYELKKGEAAAAALKNLLLHLFSKLKKY